jgi:hypothetical protein
VTQRRTLAGLALFTVALPLAVLAASPGRLLPGFPHYRYHLLPGDAYGYYYCALGLISAVRRDAPAVLGVGLAAVLLVLVVWRRSSAPAARILACTWALGLVAAVLAHAVGFTGAAQVGWPLVWAVPLFPFRIVGGTPSPDLAFGLGLALSLAFNAITVLCTYALGRAAGFTRHVALAGAALLAAWPVLSLLTGDDAGRNGTWEVFLGLALYTEPLSTALVIGSLALVVGDRMDDRRAALAGALLGFATLVRLSNALIAACVVVALVARHRMRAAVLLVVGALAWLPAAAFFWPKSYPKLKPPVFPEHPFALSYIRMAWTDSYLWHPLVLLVLLPIALLGIRRAVPGRAALLWACVGVTAVFYSFYELTPIHPRFLFVVLPIVLVFWAAGAAVVIAAGRDLYHRAR